MKVLTSGFGVWEMLTHAKLHLAVSKPVVLPCTAVVYAMLIELQSNPVEGIELKEVATLLVLS